MSKDTESNNSETGQLSWKNIGQGWGRRRKPRSQREFVRYVNDIVQITFILLEFCSSKIYTEF